MKTQYDGSAKNMKAVGFPQIDREHMLFKTDTSNKQPRYDAVSQKYDVVVYLAIMPVTCQSARITRDSRNAMPSLISTRQSSAIASLHCRTRRTAIGNRLSSRTANSGTIGS